MGRHFLAYLVRSVFFFLFPHKSRVSRKYSFISKDSHFSGILYGIFSSTSFFMSISNLFSSTFSYFSLSDLFGEISFIIIDTISFVAMHPSYSFSSLLFYSSDVVAGVYICFYVLPPFLLYCLLCYVISYVILLMCLWGLFPRDKGYFYIFFLFSILLT